MAKLNSYRVTRPSLAPPGTPGHTDRDKRRGYYVDAFSHGEAASAVRARWGFDKVESLDVERWDNGNHYTPRGTMYRFSG